MNAVDPEYVEVILLIRHEPGGPKAMVKHQLNPDLLKTDNAVLGALFRSRIQHGLEVIKRELQREIGDE